MKTTSPSEQFSLTRLAAFSFEVYAPEAIICASSLQACLLKNNLSRSICNRVPAVPAPPKSRHRLTSFSSGRNRGAGIIKKDPEPGILVLKKALELFPDYFDALELLGTEYVKLGQFENAVPILTRALAINSKAGSSMFWLGVAHLKLNHIDESIEWLNQAVATNPGNANAYMNLGLAYGNKHSLDDAETAFKKAYQLGGVGAADAHLYLAGIYNTRSKYGDAWRELELYLKEAKGLKNTTQIKEMISRL